MANEVCWDNGSWPGMLQQMIKKDFTRDRHLHRFKKQQNNERIFFNPKTQIKKTGICVV